MWFVTLALAQAPCGPPDACFAEAVRLQVDEARHDAAATAYEAACDGGHAMACANLGALRERGIGGPPDLPRAAALYRRACDDGLGIPCAALGVLHANGAGVLRDDAEALRRYTQACEHGHAPGCTLVAQVHDGGFGVERSWAEAIGWYRRACDAGDPEGCTVLAGRLASLRRPEHGPEVVDLYTKACDLGAGDACVRAAAVLDEGELVPRDRKGAVAVCERACALGAAAPCCAKTP